MSSRAPSTWDRVVPNSKPARTKSPSPSKASPGTALCEEATLGLALAAEAPICDFEAAALLSSWDSGGRDTAREEETPLLSLEGGREETGSFC